jgi:hypothetical protein
LRPGPGQRRLVLIALASAALACCGATAGQAWAADDIARVIENLRTGRTMKVRVQAASVLARLRDRRVVPELGRAAVSDRQAGVRIYVLRLLANAPGGEADDEGARMAIRRALSDRRPDVRMQAQRSLAELDRRRASRQVRPGPPRGQPQELLVAVRGMGDRTGRASSAVKNALRAAILANLARTRGVRITQNDDPAAAYAIDGSIAKLTLVTTGSEVESTCGVELVVSRPPRGIVLIASGEATVIEPRISFRPERRARMESDAIDHAVKSAHENLARFFANAGASAQ